MSRNKQDEWVVTRQCYWPDGRNIVEIALGGHDYSNPNMLCRKYPGEGETYTDPREAVKVALEIRDAWRKAGTPDAEIAHGYTGGDTLPFEACTEEEAKEWADEWYEKLEKCARCSNVLGRERYGDPESGEYDCCSEWCAETLYWPKAVDESMEED